MEWVYTLNESVGTLIVYYLFPLIKEVKLLFFYYCFAQYYSGINSGLT